MFNSGNCGNSTEFIDTTVFILSVWVISNDLLMILIGPKSNNRLNTYNKKDFFSYDSSIIIGES